MSSPDQRIKVAAHALLNNLVTELGARGISVPQRKYIHQGEIVRDFAGEKCAEQFVVSLLGLTQGLIGTEGFGSLLPISCAVPMTAQFIIELTRCVTTMDSAGKAPLPEVMTEDADVTMVDFMTLPVVVADLHEAGELVPGPCRLAGMGDAIAIGPEGGVGGVSLTVFVSLI